MIVHTQDRPWGHWEPDYNVATWRTLWGSDANYSGIVHPGHAAFYSPKGAAEWSNPETIMFTFGDCGPILPPRLVANSKPYALATVVHWGSVAHYYR